jgi:hypothetical protein
MWRFAAVATCCLATFNHATPVLLSEALSLAASLVKQDAAQNVTSTGNTFGSDAHAPSSLNSNVSLPSLLLLCGTLMAAPAFVIVLRRRQPQQYESV